MPVELLPPGLRALAGKGSGIVLARDASSAGISAYELDRLVRGGVLARVRRGAYVDANLLVAAQPRDHHRLLVTATMMQSGRRPVLSHWSAAAIWGVELLGDWPDRVHVTSNAPQGGRSSGALVRHRAALAPDDICEVDGLRLTSPARTAIDLAKTLPMRDGVVVCDSVLRAGLTDATSLRSGVDRLVHQPGCAAARRAVKFARREAGSVGESLSRVVLHELGHPAPDLQTRFGDGDGFIGAVDFWWRKHRTIGEFDGKVKYGGLGTGEDPRESLWREKRREDRLRGLGNEVVRWTWWHLEHPQELDRLLRKAFARAARRWGV